MGDGGLELDDGELKFLEESSSFCDSGQKMWHQVPFLSSRDEIAGMF
jgi:hypothetical protein